MAGKGSAPGERRGGRTKGTPNRFTANIILDLERLGFNPIEKQIEVHAEAMKLYRHKIEQQKGVGAGPCLDTAERAITSIMKYVYPTRRPVDDAGKADDAAISLLEILHRLESK